MRNPVDALNRLISTVRVELAQEMIEPPGGSPREQNSEGSPR